MKKPETKSTQSNRQNKQYTEIRQFMVKRVKMFDNGGVNFDLEVNGIMIYGCRVVESKNGDFISFPQRKGGDGKYYNIAYVALKPEDQEAILGVVERMLNDEK